MLRAFFRIVGTESKLGECFTGVSVPRTKLILRLESLLAIQTGKRKREETFEIFISGAANWIKRVTLNFSSQWLLSMYSIQRNLTISFPLLHHVKKAKSSGVRCCSHRFWYAASTSQMIIVTAN